MQSWLLECARLFNKPTAVLELSVATSNLLKTEKHEHTDTFHMYTTHYRGTRSGASDSEY